MEENRQTHLVCKLSQLRLYGILSSNQITAFPGFNIFLQRIAEKNLQPGSLMPEFASD
jgi:hypothetical protein